MPDLSPPADTDEDEDARGVPDRGSIPATPRWVKVFAIIAIVLALLFVLSLLTGGQHGPGRHIPSASVTVHRVQQR